MSASSQKRCERPPGLRCSSVVSNRPWLSCQRAPRAEADSTCQPPHWAQLSVPPVGELLIAPRAELSERHMAELPTPVQGHSCQHTGISAASKPPWLSCQHISKPPAKLGP
jgi:hypothetical protein